MVCLKGKGVLGKTNEGKFLTGKLTLSLSIGQRLILSK